MKVVAFAGRSDSGVYFYRCWWPLTLLREREPGWDIVISPQFDERILAGWSPSRPKMAPIPPDVVLICREVNIEVLPYLVKAKRELGVRYVYDSDDNLFDLPVWNPAYNLYSNPEIRTNLEVFLRHADAIFVSTEYLRNVYAPFNDRIYVLENGLDIGSITKRPQSSAPRMVGWVGSHYHDLDYELAESGILDLAKNGLDAPGDLRFRLFYKLEYPQYPNIDRVHGAHWTSYFQCLSLCDLEIGLVPLVDHPFNLAKSSNRWAEQAAVGTLTIASAVGEFARNIEHGRTGILVGPDDDWAKVTRSALRDRAGMARMVGAAYEVVRARFDLSHTCHRWGDAIREVAAAEHTKATGHYVMNAT